MKNIKSRKLKIKTLRKNIFDILLNDLTGLRSIINRFLKLIWPTLQIRFGVSNDQKNGNGKLTIYKPLQLLQLLQTIKNYYSFFLKEVRGFKSFLTKIVRIYESLQTKSLKGEIIITPLNSGVERIYRVILKDKDRCRMKRCWRTKVYRAIYRAAYGLT